jgi:hypothetical protein
VFWVCSPCHCLRDSFPATSELWCSGHLVIFYRLPSSETGTLDAFYTLTDADHKVNNYNDLDSQGRDFARACSLGVCAMRDRRKNESRRDSGGIENLADPGSISVIGIFRQQPIGVLFLPRSRRLLGVGFRAPT